MCVCVEHKKRNLQPFWAKILFLTQNICRYREERKAILDMSTSIQTILHSRQKWAAKSLPNHPRCMMQILKPTEELTCDVSALYAHGPLLSSQWMISRRRTHLAVSSPSGDSCTVTAKLEEKKRKTGDIRNHSQNFYIEP
jgi:hypothetical protein